MTQERTLAPVPDWLIMPFHYASLSCFRVYLRAERARLEGLLAGTETTAADLAGDAVYALDFQRYTAHLDGFLATTLEVELCALVTPAARAAQTPRLSLAEFLAGADETRTLGYYRLHVPCDNAFAVKAGIALFGERKYEAAFEHSVPSANAAPGRVWRYTCKTPEGEALYALHADLAGVDGALADRASIVRYSTLEGRLVGSRWEQSGDLHTLVGGDLARRVQVTPGEGDHALSRDLRTLGARDVVAVQTFSSRPAAIEGRGFYVTP